MAVAVVDVVTDVVSDSPGKRDARGEESSTSTLRIITSHLRSNRARPTVTAPREGETRVNRRTVSRELDSYRKHFEYSTIARRARNSDFIKAINKKDLDKINSSQYKYKRIIDN